MEWLKDDKGEPMRVIISKSEGKEHDELLNLTFQVSKETQLSMDSVYEFTMNTLEALADSTATDENDLRDSGIESIEADVYTGDLTAWLNQSNYHVYYLTEALEEYDLKDGFAALAMAQQRAKQEVFTIVLDYLLNK